MAGDRARPRVTGGPRRARLAALALLVFGGTLTLTSPPPALAAWEALIYVDGSGSGSGRVTTADGGIDCHFSGGIQVGDCSENYVFADFVQEHYVEATYNPSPGSNFCVGGDCVPDSQSRGEFVTLSPSHDEHVLVARFQLQVHKITVDVVNSGSIAVIGDVTDCPSVPAGSDYCWLAEHGTEVGLAPKAGFSYWANLPCGGGSTSGCTFTATDSVHMQAYFGLARLSLATVGGGEACATSGGTLCTEGIDGTVSNWIKEGNTLAIEASARSGWRFKSWSSGPCGGQDRTCSFTVSNDATITATFVRIATPPPPTASPKPTLKPTAIPTAQPPSTVAPIASATPTTTLAPEPGSSLEPEASELPAGTVIPSSGALGQTPAPTSSPAPGPVDMPAAPAGIDPIVLALLGVIALLVLVVGFLLGMRTRRHGRSDSTAT